MVHRFSLIAHRTPSFEKYVPAKCAAFVAISANNLRPHRSLTQGLLLAGAALELADL
ncbi:MAG TPA: hypothetical protein VI197_29855 [Polyangiaceae bacterium]